MNLIVHICAKLSCRQTYIVLQNIPIKEIKVPEVCIPLKAPIRLLKPRKIRKGQDCKRHKNLGSTCIPKNLLN